MNCYCSEFTENPELVELQKDVPEGYCGLCSICGEPGHIQPHPHLPVTDAWCDSHYEMLTTQKLIPLSTIVGVTIICIALISCINWIARAFF